MGHKYLKSTQNATAISYLSKQVVVNGRKTQSSGSLDLPPGSSAIRMMRELLLLLWEPASCIWLRVWHSPQLVVFSIYWRTGARKFNTKENPGHPLGTLASSFLLSREARGGKMKALVDQKSTMSSLCAAVWAIRFFLQVPEGSRSRAGVEGAWGVRASLWALWLIVLYTVSIYLRRDLWMTSRYLPRAFWGNSKWILKGAITL